VIDFRESVFWDVIATPTCRGKQSGGGNYIASSFAPHPEIATVTCGDLAMTWRTSKEHSDSNRWLGEKRDVEDVD
jgi:hypothetical protein